MTEKYTAYQIHKLGLLRDYKGQPYKALPTIYSVLTRFGVQKTEVDIRGNMIFALTMEEIEKINEQNKQFFDEKIKKVKKENNL